MFTPINVLSIEKKNGQRFKFIYTDDNADELLNHFARFASNPEIDFTWNDAAKLSQKVRARMAQLKSQKFVSRFSV
jgi:phage terminase large subunit-like protein